jgi:hypothetical protein
MLTAYVDCGCQRNGSPPSEKWQTLRGRGSIVMKQQPRLNESRHDVLGNFVHPSPRSPISPQTNYIYLVFEKKIQG